MIEFASLIAGVVLLLLLMVVATKGWLAARDSPETQIAQGDDGSAEACPPEFVGKIFARQDWEFVRGMKVRGLAALFQRERKRVALVWVRQASGMIQRVMREHAAAARQSKNLEFSTELKITAQYASLLLVCGILSATIHIAGPMWLGGLARFAQRLSEQMANAQQALQAATQASVDAVGSR